MPELSRRQLLTCAAAWCASPALAAAPDRVVVVGGGPAGLSAALTLAERGVPVTLLEAASRLGGKVQGWTEDLGGHPVDVEHGVHGLNRGYVNMTALLERYGLDRALRPPEPFGSAFVLHEGTYSFSPARLPGLLRVLKRRARALGVTHPTAALWRGRRWVRGLTRPEARAVLGGRSVAEHHAEGAPITPFRLMADALALSMYFVPAAGLDAATFAMAERWNTPVVRWMRGNPQTLIWEPLGEALRGQGAEIRLGARVAGLVLEDGRACGVRLGRPAQRWEVPAPPSGWTLTQAPDGAPVWLGRSATGHPLARSGLCTHAGCPVQREAAGWACPCHGGRFGPEGEVLAGPPERPLDSLDVEDLGDRWRLTAAASVEQLRASAVVLAVDAPAFARLAGPALPRCAGLRGTRHTVARFWLDRSPGPHAPAAVVCEATAHASNAFLLHRLQEPAAAWAALRGGAVVEVQAFRELPVEATAEELLDRIQADLPRIWPELAGARALKRALVSGAEFTSFHPGWHEAAATVDTGVPGLYAAGDHLLVEEDHEFMERAITTGLQAANCVLRARGLPEAPVLDWRRRQPSAAG